MVIRLFDFLKMFYPPKGSAKALGVQLIFFWFIVLSLVNIKLSFNSALVIRQKNSAKNLYCAGGGWWVGGRWSTRSFDSSQIQIRLQLRYEVIKKGIKVVTNFLMGLKICDEVGVRGAHFRNYQR